MRIRSITVFSADVSPQALIAAGATAAAVRSRLVQNGYEVQTTRLALPPVEAWLPECTPDSLLAQAKLAEAAALAHGFDYLSLGPLPTKLLPSLPRLIGETTVAFTSFSITDAQQNILTGTLAAVADAVTSIARSTPNGFGNLRFCATANCGPGTPFFPVAYSSDAFHGSFALATESADLALDACREATTTGAALENLTRAIESHSQKIERALEGCPGRYAGIDWSLAPHPDASRSIGAALEALSGAPLGGWGTLTAVAGLTRAIRRAAVKHVGFSGVFLPVLEDAVLAQRAAENSYDLPRLLLYSAVCGSGLDTIPLPGDVSTQSISALLADVATLALVLNKPLTARLMPVPGLTAGQRTRFDFPYLINTTPLELRGAAMKILRDERLWLGS